MITSVVRAFFHSGLPERGHAVGDRLDAGDRGAAGGEGVQHDEERRAHEQPAALAAEAEQALLAVLGDREVAEQQATEAQAEEQRPC